jgi:uncharacterized metal-binding protein
VVNKFTKLGESGVAVFNLVESVTFFSLTLLTAIFFVDADFTLVFVAVFEVGGGLFDLDLDLDFVPNNLFTISIHYS